MVVANLFARRDSHSGQGHSRLVEISARLIISHAPSLDDLVIVPHGKHLSSVSACDARVVCNLLTDHPHDCSAVFLPRDDPSRQ